jgi:thymidylate synthase
MFSAWPANAMGLRALQAHIRDEIAQRSHYDLKLGPLITISQSAHIYDDTWENADLLIQKEYTKICRQRLYNDPVGNFVITVDDGDIAIEHTTPCGESVKKYQGKSAALLSRQIAADCPGIQIDHALYLGCELQKAEIAQRSKIPYEQDHGLK